jgi:hypothetical protein
MYRCPNGIGEGIGIGYTAPSRLNTAVDQNASACSANPHLDRAPHTELTPAKTLYSPLLMKSRRSKNSPIFVRYAAYTGDGAAQADGASASVLENQSRSARRLESELALVPLHRKEGAS